MTGPNVIILTVDQLAARCLSLYGGDVLPTPNIDRLAAEGVAFDHMVSTCPVCTPYRSMWLTGRHPQSTGSRAQFCQYPPRRDRMG